MTYFNLYKRLSSAITTFWKLPQTPDFAIALHHELAASFPDTWSTLSIAPLAHLPRGSTGQPIYASVLLPLTTWDGAVSHPAPCPDSHVQGLVSHRYVVWFVEPKRMALLKCSQASRCVRLGMDHNSVRLPAVLLAHSPAPAFGTAPDGGDGPCAVTTYRVSEQEHWTAGMFLTLLFGFKTADCPTNVTRALFW